MCTGVVFYRMELLSYFGVSSELSKEEFVRRLERSKAEQVQGLRRALFESAVRKGLGEEEDELVTRKKVVGGKSVKEKHVEDVWTLTGCYSPCLAEGW